MDAIPARRDLEYHSLGDRSTADVLEGETGRISKAGQRALANTVDKPTLATFMRVSRKFAREAELLTGPVRDVVDDVADAGGSATMAMLGETVIALDSGLSDAGYDEATKTAIDPCGARLEP